MYPISPETAVFVVISFEGPDPYSQAGGLGTRVAGLTEALAEAGLTTHLYFVGDPNKDAIEKRVNGNLILHRWCQWISKFHPAGVYDGEISKVLDMNNSLPWEILQNVAKPAAADGKILVVLAEEWHTGDVICNLSDLLYYNGLRNHALLLWNANNDMAFHRINTGRLLFAGVTFTTVSKFMKHTMWPLGVNPLVVPNVIPQRWLDPVDPQTAREFRKLFPADFLLTKVGRFDPDKRWLTAVGSVAQLKGVNSSATLIMRGGIEPHGAEVLGRAYAFGLTIKEIAGRTDDIGEFMQWVARAMPADTLNLRAFLPEEFLHVMYCASDAVLANSGYEPFGLVGLEAMATGGIAFTGATGEDYAIPLENAIVLETDDPSEIIENLIYLKDNPEIAKRIREGARETAERFTWSKVVENLVSKLNYLARKQNIQIAGGQHG